VFIDESDQKRRHTKKTLWELGLTDRKITSVFNVDKDTV